MVFPDFLPSSHPIAAPDTPPKRAIQSESTKASESGIKLYCPKKTKLAPRPNRKNSDAPWIAP